MDNTWYTINNADKVDTPALVVYPDRVEKNINIAKQILSETERLRPHVKTHKSAHVTKMLMDAGIYKFKCATISEAEMLGACGVSDVLLAYQPVGPKIERLLELIRRYPDTTFSCLVDNIDAANALNEASQKHNHCLPVYLDLNIGMNRTGITPGSDAVDLYMSLLKMEGLLPTGLHAYDGHIRDSDITIRTHKCIEALAPVESMRQALIQKGAQEPEVIAGGTPTFPVHAKRTDAECSPGTFVFWDKGYHDLLPDQPFLYAALIMTRVISKPAPDTICIDLGHKSVASENPLNKRVFFLNIPDAEPVGHSEEHMTIRTVSGNHFKTGDVIYGVPYHICPTCALYDSAVVVHDHIAFDVWPIEARTRKISI